MHDRPRVILIGYGNPGRLDDGLGPALASLAERWEISGVKVDADYQLTVEDAAECAEYDIVIFADAAVDGEGPFYFRALEPAAELSFSTHSVSPAAVLGLAGKLLGGCPRGYVLGIRGYEFNEFAERLSPRAQSNLSQAAVFLEDVLRRGVFEQAIDHRPAKDREIPTAVKEVEICKTENT